MKRKLIICNIFIVLVILCTSVYAATTAKLNLVTTPEERKIKSGDKFTVKISLKDFSQSTSVDTISGYIDIDENIVEDITIANIVRTSESVDTVKIGNEELEVYDVTKIEGIPEKGIFLMKDPADAEYDYKITIELSTDNKISTEDIIQIEFETKDNLKEDTYADIVKFVDFEATSGWTETIDIEEQNISIEIVSDNVDDGNKDDGNKDDGNKDDGNKDDGNKDDGNKVENKVQNKVENKVQNKVENKANLNKAGTNTKDNTLANKILPATGATSVIVKVIAVGLLLGAIVYAKYKKYKNI